MNGLKYISLYKQESFGDSGGFGIEIMVAATKLPDLKQEKINYAVYEAVDKVKAEIMAAIKTESPKTMEETAQNKKLTGLFPDHIFVEEVPNGYCSDWCCRHLPWFIITTSIGRFKIGWRKRVINIDWSETLCKEYSADLFKDEETTKYDHYIHAWNMEKAMDYIDRIIESANKPTALDNKEI